MSGAATAGCWPPSWPTGRTCAGCCWNCPRRWTRRGSGWAPPGWPTGWSFTAVPAGGDVYVLARVLHNWADDAAVRILCRVREAMDGAMDGATDGAARL